MFIESIELKNYRNYDDLHLDLCSGTNILYGDNAQGKTNILEVVYVCSTTKSHRGSKDKELIHFGQDESHIKLQLRKQGVPYRIDMHLKKSKAKGIAVNGSPIRRASELFEIVNVVFFSPADLNIIKNGPSERRRFIDLELCQLNKLYVHALIQYNKVVRGAGDTVRSIIISANARLGILENPQILRVLDRDEMDIEEIGTGVDGDKNKKTALFCVIPDSDKSYNFLVGMLYSQIFQELYYQADFNYNGRLPVHVTFMLDEFANVALPDDFCSLLSTMRSREISCIIIIQNLAQIKALFKDTWETIPGNCDTLIYLGGNEQSTHKYVSESLGKGTIDKRSSGETRGRNGSSSRNYDVLGRELLTPDETRKLKNDQCIVLIRGYDPIIDRKFNTFKHPLFKETEDGGAPPYVHRIEDTQNTENVKLLNEESLAFYKRKKENGEPVHILELSADELFAANPIPEKIFSKNELEENRKASRPHVKEVMERTEDNSQKRSNENTTGRGGKAVRMPEEEALFELLSKNPYSPDQLEEIRQAIGAGIPYKNVLAIADIHNTAEQMKELRQKFTKDTAG